MVEVGEHGNQTKYHPHILCAIWLPRAILSTYHTITYHYSNKVHDCLSYHGAIRMNKQGYMFL